MVKKQLFGSVNGKDVYKYTLYRNGAEFSVINYGATLTNVCVRDKNGNKTDVLLGFDSLEDYLNNKNYCGATVGRFAGRIENACINYGGINYPLDANEGNNTLHGGNVGFDKYVWESYIDNDTVVMSHISGDGDCGFFGDLNVRAEFFWDDNCGLNIVYTAVTDTESAVNLTNHAFFNLNGEGFGNILNHKVKIFSSSIAEVDNALIANGRFIDVADTPFDFSCEKTISDNLTVGHPQLTFGDGIDHYFYADGKLPSGLFAEFTGDKSGIKMQTYTN